MNIKVSNYFLVIGIIITLLGALFKILHYRIGILTGNIIIILGIESNEEQEFRQSANVL